MTAGVYTITVDILGGDAVLDEWGDPTEGTEVLVEGVPALIVERRQVVATESDSQMVTVYYYTGRVPAGTEVTADHRLRDTSSGVLYSIDHVNPPTSPAVPGDIRLDLRRVA